MLFEDALANAYKDNSYTQNLCYERLWLGRGGQIYPKPIPCPWFHTTPMWLVIFWERALNNNFCIVGVVLCGFKAPSRYELKLIAHEERNYVWTLHREISLLSCFNFFYYGCLCLLIHRSLVPILLNHAITKLLQYSLYSQTTFQTWGQTSTYFWVTYHNSFVVSLGHAQQGPSISDVKWP